MASKLFSLFDASFKLPTDTHAAEAQSLDSISSKKEEQDFFLTKLRQLEIAEPKIDYSDFKNFVFFNSALDYFNITGEKILNEYPYDGSRDQLENFLQDLDGYQRHLIDTWPSSQGSLSFVPSVSSSYVVVLDSGVTAGDGTNQTAQVGLLSPGTGSVSLEFWCQAATPSGSTVSYILQKVGAGTDGYSVYVRGSSVVFRVSSGSATYTEVSAAFTPGATSYFAFVYDVANQAGPQLRAYVGSSTQFPVVAASASCGFTGSILNGTANLYMGSGTLPSLTSSAFSGTLDEVRIWSKPLDLAAISGTYNVKAFAETGLVGLWHFNESGSLRPDDGTNAVVQDASGKNLNGKVMNYWSGVRSRNSLLPFDAPDLILNLATPEVQYLVQNAQASASIYDRVNDNIVTRLVPEQFLIQGDIQQTTVLPDFLYILARHWDFLKIRIDQFVHILRTNYSQFDQTPDALLSDIARFFGWEFTGNFLSADAFQYLLGKNVLANQDANRELDMKLYQIKNEFWKRTLINLVHLYKTKGTRESVETLFRIYGVNKNFVRLKEYGYKPNVGISTNRIHAEKSVYAFAFNTASLSGSLQSPYFVTPAYSVETRVNFPTTASSDNAAFFVTGSVWSLVAGTFSSGSVGPPFSTPYQLYWTRNGIGSPTGSLFFTGSEGLVSLTGVGIFDDRWYNVVCSRDPLSGTMAINVNYLDIDDIDLSVSASLPVSVVTSSTYYSFCVGSSFGLPGAPLKLPAQMWIQETRVWDRTLNFQEMQDHALNFQSYGVSSYDDSTQLELHWRLRENISADGSGLLASGTIKDVSTHRNDGLGLSFQTNAPSSSLYKKFLLDYNYIASPEFAWNEDKIRTFNSSELRPSDVRYDNQLIGLEFNMVDALNEDVSQIVASLDGFNNAMGLPANRYRSNYQSLDVLRRQYFKRLQGRLNFRVFADMLDFFDQSFITMVRRLLPARAVFLGDEFVVESHMLERPKLQWNYRRQTRPFIPEGAIKMYTRT